MGHFFTKIRLTSIISGLTLVFLALPVKSQDLVPALHHPNIAPALRQSAGKIQPQVRVQVTDQAHFKTWAKTALPQVSFSTTTLPNTFLFSKVSPAHLRLLAGCPWVSFVDVGNRVPQEEAYLQNSDLRVNRVTAVHLAYPEIHGKGLVASVKEQPFDSTDLDLRARVVPSEAFKQPAKPHATAMATLIAGGGNTAPSSKGVAWQSKVTAADFSNLLPDNGALLQAQGVSVQNHSYGVGLENYYGLESQAYDRQSLQYPSLLHVFSSGNAGHLAPSNGPYATLRGFANLTGQFKVSKNTLSVGAIDTSGQVSLLSSRGPTYDGRLKPELVAFGEAGTSEAASVVSGIALLVQDAYKKQTGTLPSSALVKAILINAADDKGRPEVDYAAGFGNVDAVGAVQAILENRYASGAVAQGGTSMVRIVVPPGTASVKVTLVWQDEAGSPNAPKALVNDLDLVLRHKTSGNQWLPWGLSTFAHRDSLSAPARRKADHLNNVEQVTVSLPEAGEYEVLVQGYQLTGEQSFNVVYEFEKKFSWSHPTAGGHLKAGQKNRLRWIAPLRDGATGKLEFRWDSPGAPWQTLRESVTLAAEALDITFPDTTALAQIRMVAGSDVYETGTVVISPTLNLTVGYQCEEDLLLYWSAAVGAEGYEVYAPGAQYLVPLVQTTDTVVILKKSQHRELFYAVAPIVKGKRGERSLSINYTQLGTGCYIKSFLAKRFVTDTVQLALEISTSIGLKAMFLERKVNGAFQILAPVPLGGQTVYQLEDKSPVVGFNEYRIKIVTEAGAVFYSHIERIAFTNEQYILVYPNPGLAGDKLNILTQDDDTNRILIYDQVGRLIREFDQDGAVKVIETAGIKPGAYFIRVYSSTGVLTQSKIILL